MKLKSLCLSLFFAVATAVSGMGINVSAQSSNSSKAVSTPQSNTVTEMTLTSDVVIIGAGGAGLSAAIEAHDKGASVIVVEKMPFAGGNTVRAKGGINAAGTSVQKAEGIEDSPELFISDTMKGGKEKNNTELVKYLAENSASAVEWLISMGADLSVVSSSGGASVKRIHRPKGGSDAGAEIIRVLKKNAEEKGIEVKYYTKATQILTDDGKVSGIVAEDVDGNRVVIKSDAVIIATGGFGANEEMYTKLKSELKGFVTTNHSGATGDGILLAESMGAATVDMNEIQIHPTVEQSTSELVSESLRGDGAILVNSKGERFFNEMETRDKVSQAVLAQEGKWSYILFDENVFGKNAGLKKLSDMGLVLSGDTVEALAEKAGMDAAVLKASVDTWNKTVTEKAEDKFGRTTGIVNPIDKAPYYAIKIAPGIHHTMGGIVINTSAEVLDKDGKAIPGLYAAGETTGGVHGANRLGGNALADIVVFGRTAGIKAAEAALQDGKDEVTGTSSKPSEERKFKEGAEPLYKDGEYQGTGKGNNGEITVKVIVKDGFIAEISPVSHEETEGIWDPVEENLFKDIVFSQGTEVDTVSGATNSSKGVIEAVNNALKDARK